MTSRALAGLALAAAVLGGCASDETLSAPDLSSSNGLFRRYVAIGTSISAGFQSGGINDSTQRRAFPVLVGAASGAPFAYPALQGRGCPAPLVNNVTGVRVGNQPPTSPCDLRAQPAPPYVNNLAVPGLETRDIFSPVASPLSTYERLATFFLGGRTPIRALMESQATFVSVELGANEILGALLASNNPGTPDSLSPLPSFQASYSALLDSIVKLGARGVLFTAPDVTVIPYASTGTTYWCLGTGNCPGIPRQFPPNVTINNNCAPQSAIPTSRGDSILVPFPIGVTGVLRAAQGVPFTLDCSNDLQVVTPAEFRGLRQQAASINAFITSQAQQRGFALVDANAVLAALRATGQVPPFPDISQVATGGPIRFGTFFSLDGFHPASPTHRVVADSMIAAVNRTFQTTIPFVGP